VETSTPLSAALTAGHPVVVERTPSFVDGIGGRGVLEEMWPIISDLVHGALVATLAETRAAIRLLVERTRVVAEGAGAVPIAAALAGRAGTGTIVCVVSGGNIDTKTLIDILSG
jgi:threonine dehydratase